MNKTTPRIKAVTVNGQKTIQVHWQSGGADTIDLSGWIATGGETLAPLSDLAAFQRAAVGDYGTSIEWDDGDLAIDSAHLEALAIEQRPFRSDDMVEWQAKTGLSNQEAAQFLGVALSTWHTYKTGSPIPAAVAIACRAALRDPLLLQAHYKPRKTGRPPRPAA